MVVRFNKIHFLSLSGYCSLKCSGHVAGFVSINRSMRNIVELRDKILSTRSFFNINHCFVRYYRVLIPVRFFPIFATVNNIFFEVNFVNRIRPTMIRVVVVFIITTMIGIVTDIIINITCTLVHGTRNLLFISILFIGIINFIYHYRKEMITKYSRKIKMIF